MAASRSSSPLLALAATSRCTAQLAATMFGNDGVPECGDFKRGACFRATCKFLHNGKPGNEGGGIPGSVNGGSAGLPGPRPAGQFEISDEDRNAMDLNLYDPNTGFGLFGTSAFGTRWGQTGPMVKCDNVRPLCMDFFKNGVCNRRGPHNQGCLFRHDEIEGQGKVEIDDPHRPEAWVVENFANEAKGLYVFQSHRLAYSDVQKEAKEYAKQKEKELIEEEEAKKQRAEAEKAAAAAILAAPKPLPAGWKETKAPDGRTYFYHAETKKTSWTRPTADGAAGSAEGGAAASLPAGWKETKAPDGRTYYYHAETKKTSWKLPTADAAVAAANAAAAPAPADADAAAAPAAEGAAPAEAAAPADAGASDGAAAGDAGEADEQPAKRARSEE